MSTLFQPRVRSGTSAGQFSSPGHNVSSVTLGASRFPHPDQGSAHPMERWPQEIESPASIEVSSFEDRPLVTLTMDNGAALTLHACALNEFPESEALFDGDWASYTAGDPHLMDDVLNTASETLSQCSR